MKRLLALFVTIALIGCQSDSDTYTLEGIAQGFADGTQILVYERVDNAQPVVVDTLTVQGEKFLAAYPKTDKLAMGYLMVEQPRGSVVFFPENEDIRVYMYQDSMNASYAMGSAQNELYREYIGQIRAYAQKRQEISQQFQQARQEQDNMLATELQKINASLNADEKAYKTQFVKDHSNVFFSALLLTEMLGRKEIAAAEAKEISQGFPPRIASSKLAKDLNNTIENMKRADVGGIAPDFTAPTPDGEMLSLKDAMGKYTIIDFWASWCKPCRRENPNVVSVYEKYHDKGLNIISVSLDRTGQKDRWVQAIEDDKMDWYHVSNLKFWQDPIAQTYNVRAIPATFLLDENGKIIDKNLLGVALHTRIAQLLGE
jgi:thiol-disulfide isomerase/thioredoxin